MSNLSINPLRPNALGSDTIGGAARTDSPLNSSPDQTKTSTAKVAGTATDSVSISAGALSPNASTSSNGDLTDSQATDASLALRQQLTSHGLSAKAKQNQAILSLLR